MGLLLKGWGRVVSITLKAQTSPSACEDTWGEQGTWGVQLGRAVGLTHTTREWGGASQCTPEQAHQSEARGRKYLGGGVPRSTAVDPRAPHTAWGSGRLPARERASRAGQGHCTGLEEHSVLRSEDAESKVGGQG